MCYHHPDCIRQPSISRFSSQIKAILQLRLRKGRSVTTWRTTRPNIWTNLKKMETNRACQYVIQLYMIFIYNFGSRPKIRIIAHSNAHSDTTSWHLKCYLVDLFFVHALLLSPQSLTHPHLQNQKNQPRDARNAHLTVAFGPPFGWPLGSKVRKHQAWNVESGRYMKVPSFFNIGKPTCNLVYLQTIYMNLVMMLRDLDFATSFNKGIQRLRQQLPSCLTLGESSSTHSDWWRYIDLYYVPWG